MQVTPQEAEDTAKRLVTTEQETETLSTQADAVQHTEVQTTLNPLLLQEDQTTQLPVCITVIQTPEATEQDPLAEALEVTRLAQATVIEARDTQEVVLPEVILLVVIAHQDPALQTGVIVLLLEVAHPDLVQQDHLVHQAEEDNPTAT